MGSERGEKDPQALPNEVVPPLKLDLQPLLSDSKELTPQEKVARHFATAILIGMGVVILILLGNWFLRHPTAPTLSGSIDDQKKTLEVYSSYTKLAWDEAERPFDMIITKGFLPVFLTIVGFLLGRKTKSD